MSYEKPVLSADDMAVYVAASPYLEYRRACIKHFKAIHGDEYADAVQNKVLAIFNGRKKHGK